MKRKWHIKTHMLVTLIGLTSAMRLTVVLVFNLSMFGFIRSRVSTQLSNVSQSVSDERRNGGHGQKDQGAKEENKGRFNEHPDRVTGTRGSAVLLNGDGSLLSNLNGDETAAEALAAWYAQHAEDGFIQNKVVFLDLEGIDMNLAQRIIDFTSGATYAIDGTLQQMSKYTFVIAPPVVSVSGDFQDALSTNSSVTF